MGIWQIFAWPAPYLSRLVIRCSDIMEQYPGELAVGFPDISSLKHLDISEMNLKFLKLENSSLESLVTLRGVRDWSAIGLSRLTRLQRLEVTDIYSKLGDLERFTLDLPRLRHLILNGVKNLDAVDFRVPVLYTLDLVCWDLSGFPPLPKLQSLHVRWKYKGRPSTWSHSILLAEMKKILVQFHMAVNLTIDELARSALIEAVQSLPPNGELSNALQSIIVETADGEETLPVTSLC
jgi:hypothetical protein